MQRAMWSGFMRSAELFGDRPALLANGKTLSYRELRETACRIAATIQRTAGFDATPLTAVFGYRTPIAFAGVLGALLSGNGYVPLNRTFPIARTKSMFRRADCASIIVDAGCVQQLDELLDQGASTILVLLPEADDVTALEKKWPQHKFVGSQQLAPASDWREPTIDIDAIAYLLFTSGSSGVPKGVMVAQRSVLSFLSYMLASYEVTEHDRFSQMFDLTFDLSVFDMFMCWERGACLCCPSQKTLISPGRFIQENELTIWFSVPSTVMFMKQMGLLKANLFPKLRLSLFCGEPLPISSAAAWSSAAPNTIVENLYGPTELTIACTRYRWNQEHSREEAELDIVPIGYPYGGMKALIVDESLKEVAAGQSGELLMGGPQLSLGYWKDPEKTAAAFVTPPGQTEVYYRTGDRVRRPTGNGPIVYLGRNDFQVKVLGHRVELGEIEARVRKVYGLDGVVAVGWPATPSGFGGVEVFIEGEVSDRHALQNTVAAELPEYMVPRRYHYMDRLSRNVNGKFDRKALTDLLEAGL